MSDDEQAEGGAGTHERPPTPEEVARAFIRDGGVVVFDEPDERRVRRRKSVLGAVLAVLVIAGAVVAFVILSTPKKAAPHLQPSALKTTSTTVAPKSTTTTTTTVPLPANSAVTVDVLNASNALDLAAQTATGLRQVGFVVSGISDASSVIAAGDPSEIFYGPDGRPAAQALALSLNGPVSLVPSAVLTGNNVTLWAAGPQLTVKTTTTTTAS